MAPSNPRVVKAFRAMKDIGITEDKVKPVLKNLLKLYEKNWELIEEENYRVLADAIFDEEDNKVSEQNKCKNADEENFEEEALVHDELERPLKRIRLRNQEGPVTPSLSNCNPSSSGTLLKTPKVEDDLPGTSYQQQSQEITKSAQPNVGNIRTEPQAVSPQHHTRNTGKQPVSPKPLPGTFSQQQSQDITKSAQTNVGNIRTEPRPVSSQHHTRNMGKQPVSPKPLAVRERSDPFLSSISDRTQPCATGRSESNSLLSDSRAGNKGKEPFSPQIVPREKRYTSERASHAVRIKDPSAMVEPGIVLLPKQKVPDTLALIKPKDEPFTDDMLVDDIPQYEVPIAVIHPDSLSKADSSVGNVSMGKSDCQEPPASHQIDTEKGGDGDKRTNCELATIPEDSPSLEIASSSLGEVKISLSCISGLGRPNFHMPSLDELKESMEEKCLRSYKIIDPSFSFMKLMTDMCECFLELASNSSHESQEGLLDARDALGVENNIKNMCMQSTTNGSIDIQCSAEVSTPQIPRPLQYMNNLDTHIQINKEVIVNCCAESAEGREFKDLEFTNSGSLVVVPQCQLTPDELRSFNDVNDITKGEEGVEISWINEINNECPPSFYYIPRNLVFQNANVKFSLSQIGDENCCSTCFGDCLSSAVPCACAHETGGEFAYTSESLVKEEILKERIFMTREKQNLLFCRECPVEKSKNEDILEACKGHLERKIIKECWSKCGCIKQCGNRVVQRGIIRKLQVFFTPEGKGWGIRTLEKLPKGAFVCEFVGEILTIRELYERRMQNANSEKHTCPVLLDAFWVSKIANDEEALSLDATCYGNVARFINHRCFDANLIEIPVEVETPDHYYYHLAFFTTREVDAMEELTWDYGIDFDDHDHPVKPFRCQCGSKFCRNMKRSNRSRSSNARRTDA